VEIVRREEGDERVKMEDRKREKAPRGREREGGFYLSHSAIISNACVAEGSRWAGRCWGSPITLASSTLRFYVLGLN